jgi:tetratricopeptide (TPR) repeat protein
MPLRLTGTDTAEAPAATRPLPERAHARLLAGDADGYRALAAEAAAVPDAQARHAATVALVEAGLIAARRVSGASRIRGQVAVAETALHALEASPAEPLLLHYAGIAAFELWMLDAASGLLRAARRLDPALPHLEANLTALSQRRRGPRPVRPLHPALPGLARRATDVVRRARPASGMTISLCMIVRDEAAMLGRCLASVAGGVDEIVVVDTGSRDETREIARRHGARVIEHPWTGSFAEARNVSLAAATGDWLLFLDADEVLVEGDAERLREYAGHTWREALFLTETSYTGELGDGTAITHLALRMFRNRPEYRFTGAIHEQIAPALPTAVPGRVGTSSLRIDHFGYLGDVRRSKEKFTRNLELLKRQEQELGSSPFLHYNIGTEYAGAGDFGAATHHLTTAWTLLDREGTLATVEYGPLVVGGLVRALRGEGRLDEADTRARAGLELFPEFTDLVWELGATALARGEIADARRHFERCRRMGDAPPRHGGQSGAGTYFPRIALASIALDHDHDPAAARAHLQWCLTHHPGYLGVAGPYVTASLRDGEAPATVRRALESALHGIPTAVRLVIAQTLRREGFARDAAAEYRGLLGDDVPESTRGVARAALAELLLAAGELEAAAAEAARVPDDSSRAALACRIETSARLAAGETAGARTALRRAGAVGLPLADTEMLEAWLAVADGGPTRSLGLACVPLLATLFELMLGAGALEAAATLRTLLAASALPDRDGRQLVAEAQLRHGDLAAAAAEWMEVCHAQADAPALAGLAQVALRHGLAGDARTFAAAALELDPGCRPARALLDAVDATPAADAGAPVPAAATVDG